MYSLCFKVPFDHEVQTADVTFGPTYVQQTSKHTCEQQLKWLPFIPYFKRKTKSHVGMVACYCVQDLEPKMRPPQAELLNVPDTYLITNVKKAGVYRLYMKWRRRRGS